MAYIIGTMLILLSLIIISYPFLKSHLPSRAILRPEELEELDRTRQPLFDEMERLKLDLDVVNITQEEYEERMAGLRRAVAASLRDEELLPTSGNLDEAKALEVLDSELEEKIRLLRFSQEHKNGTGNCRTCGRQLKAEDTVCSQCGTEVPSNGSPRN